MIKVRVAEDGTKSFQVYERARIREKSIKVYLGSFSSRRDAEFAAQQHRVTQRGIKDGELPAAVDHKRTMGDALDAWLKAIKDQRSHDEYESRMRLYVRPTFDSTPLVKITKAKLIDLRTSLKEREEPIGNATINTLFASLSAKTSVFRPFKAALLRAGLAKKLRLHDLRHTFAGLFLASGGDIFKLSKILGHSSVAITHRSSARSPTVSSPEMSSDSPTGPTTSPVTSS